MSSSSDQVVPSVHVHVEPSTLVPSEVMSTSRDADRVYVCKPGETDVLLWANHLFLWSIIGYLILDLIRVAYPLETIMDPLGANITNGLFMAVSIAGVIDACLYFVVYQRLESAVVEREEEEERRLQRTMDHNHEIEAKHDDDEETSEHEGLVRRRNAPTGIKDKMVASAAETIEEAKWCLSHFEGATINVCEIFASSLYCLSAIITFVVGLAMVPTSLQRRWDTVTMIQELVAMLIFSFDACVYHHIYMRAQQTTCCQVNDVYFHASVTNFSACLFYLVAAAYGLIRQQDIAMKDRRTPGIGIYDKEMLWVVRDQHAMCLAGDVLYIICGLALIYAYRQERKERSKKV